MDAVRKAIHSSIKKYDDLSKPGYEIKLMCNSSIDAKGCELCKLFPRKDCAGCPVRRFTRERACKGTPYYRLYEAIHAAHAEMVTGTYADTISSIVEAKKAAKEMADFLRGVLKHYDKNKKD